MSDSIKSNQSRANFNTLVFSSSFLASIRTFAHGTCFGHQGGLVLSFPQPGLPRPVLNFSIKGINALNCAYVKKVFKNSIPSIRESLPFMIKNRFSKLENPSRFYIIILNGAQNLEFPGFWYATLIGWILYTFQGYKYKIRLVSILWKREDQALISISIIQKFSALNYHKIHIFIKINDK